MLIHCLLLHLQKEVASERRLPVTEKGSLFIALNLTNTHDLRKESIMKNTLTSTVGRFCQKTQDVELWRSIAYARRSELAISVGNEKRPLMCGHFPWGIVRRALPWTAQMWVVKICPFSSMPNYRFKVTTDFFSLAWRNFCCETFKSKLTTLATSQDDA